MSTNTIQVVMQPDGNGDYAAAIQAAIDEMLAAPAQVNNILVPPGDWQVNQVPGGALKINLKTLPSGGWLNLISQSSPANVVQQNGFTMPNVPNCVFRSKIPNKNNLTQTISTVALQGSDFENTQNPGYVWSQNRHCGLVGLTMLGYVLVEPSLGGGFADNQGIGIDGVDGFVVYNCAVDSNTANNIGVQNSRGVISNSAITGLYFDAIGGIWNYGVQVSGNLFPASISSAYGIATWVEDVTKIWGKYDWIGIPLTYDILPTSAVWTPNFETAQTSNLTFTAGPVYMEDCFFDRCRHSVTASSWGYYVVRNSNFVRGRPGGFPFCDMHGGPRSNLANTAYATRFGEIYNCTFDGLGQDPANPNGVSATSYGVDTQGGGGIFYNNTIKNVVDGINIAARGYDASMPNDPQYPWNTYVWNNKFANVQNILYLGAGVTAGKNYFTDSCGGLVTPTTPAPPPAGWTPYTYPHPLVTQLIGMLPPPVTGLSVYSTLAGIPFNVTKIA